MFFEKVLLALTFIISSYGYAKDVTFRDVTLHGYQIYTHKFETKIVSSNNLGENIPENVVFDALEISNATIPVLYENSITDLDDLDELILVYDGIREIRPGAFKNVPMLRVVNLERNSLEEISEGVFNGLAISEINLSHNLLKKIDTNALSNMPNLMYINLAHNMIGYWDGEWFAADPLLTRVSLAYNQIATLPTGAFKNLAGEKHFGKLNLKLYIDLSHNKINVLKPEILNGLSKVDGLWLDHNHLSEIDENLFEGLALELLNLNDNKLVCLNGDISKILKASNTNIDGNPWNCTCLENIKEWSKKNENFVQMSYAEMECYAQRIRTKMDALQDRLNEIKNQ